MCVCVCVWIKADQVGRKMDNSKENSDSNMKGGRWSRDGGQ